MRIITPYSHQPGQVLLVVPLRPGTRRLSMSCMCSKCDPDFLTALCVQIPLRITTFWLLLCVRFLWVYGSGSYIPLVGRFEMINDPGLPTPYPRPCEVLVVVPLEAGGQVVELVQYVEQPLQHGRGIGAPHHARRADLQQDQKRHQLRQQNT